MAGGSTAHFLGDFPLEMLKKLNTTLSLLTQRSVYSFGLIINESNSRGIICKIQPSKKKSVFVRDRPHMGLSHG